MTDVERHFPFCEKRLHNSPRIEEMQKLMGVNLYAPIYLSRAFARHWLGLPAKVSSNSSQETKPERLDLKKKIIFVSSISSFVNMTPQCQVAYHASKAGVTMAAKVSCNPKWCYKY